MRNQFQTILSDTVNNLVIRDPLSIDWASFPWDNGYTTHIISSVEIIKPYKISLAYYSSVDYEDVILLLNKIENIFDVSPEKEIWIPDFTELKKWLSERQSA